MTLIISHPIVILLALFFVAALLALVIGGILAAAGRADVQMEHIEPHDLQDDVHCAWCIKEQGGTPDPNDSHSVCPRHAEKVLREAKRFNKAA